ncbi:MAG: hypothetical protein L0287_01930 [Anaerolineae bacterium]|nr:hypothetical protein [Anaerolineae bacterium]MCI0607541.1 hypothetical protein [Anaerolineae bacterium]
MKYLTITFLFALLLVSCATAPATSNTLPPDTVVTHLPGSTMPANEPSVNPLAPKPGDDNLTRGNVFIQEHEMLIRESFPPQISLVFRGDLPTPCHELRAVVNPPDDENKIIVEAYSVVDPNMACIQVLEPFENSINLGTFPSGHYTVWINGEMAGEFDT